MAKFPYNNTNNTNISHISFELNCKYHFCFSYIEDINLCSKLKSANELSAERIEFLIIY